MTTATIPQPTASQVWQRMADLGKAQMAVNIMYRISARVDRQSDFTSECIKMAIASGKPFAVILKELAEQCAYERSRGGMVSVLGETIVNDILKWYEL